jgi:hypothetical protein
MSTNRLLYLLIALPPAAEAAVEQDALIVGTHAQQHDQVLR